MLFFTTDIVPLVSEDYTTSDYAKPDCLYGSQVIDLIMRKPGKIYTV